MACRGLAIDVFARTLSVIITILCRAVGLKVPTVIIYQRKRMIICL